MKLRYTPRALREVKRAISYIGERSPEGARSVAERLNGILIFLQEHPFAGTSNSYKGTRHFFMKPYPYVVHYQVVGAEVVILRFRHTSRKVI
ncbi:type II toxin-antitoxin system RelE/ParE family toxin [Neorhizobium lilium]|uniref:type II toxin-antitoxin system RelE/ParE family toxin n=1 Tax=Neorhizobium lilium TaxID=2503024 RepID=UPI00198042D0